MNEMEDRLYYLVFGVVILTVATFIVHEFTKEFISGYWIIFFGVVIIFYFIIKQNKKMRELHQQQLSKSEMLDCRIISGVIGVLGILGIIIGTVLWKDMSTPDRFSQFFGGIVSIIGATIFFIRPVHLGINEYCRKLVRNFFIGCLIIAIIIVSFMIINQLK